ncbi:MAG: hypothetical protein H6Q90_5674 [Deltaproteobacteria bacterium]|nr:hypothetical protein [Deltaproteobacteria bacterium]
MRTVVPRSASRLRYTGAVGFWDWLLGSSESEPPRVDVTRFSDDRLRRLWSERTELTDGARDAVRAECIRRELALEGMGARPRSEPGRAMPPEPATTASSSTRDDVREQRYADGRLWRRWQCRAGREHGRFEELSGSGAPAIDGAYEDGVPVGRWIHRRPDGSILAQVDHEAGVACRFEARTAGGQVRPPVPSARAEHAELWARLFDMWDDVIAERETVGLVQAMLKNWPVAARLAPVEWLLERRAAGEGPPSWYSEDWELLVDPNDDPRAALIDKLQIGHDALTDEQSSRLARHASRLRSLALTELDLSSRLNPLFGADVEWPRLEHLSVDECYPADHVIALLRCIAQARLPALRSLWLDDAIPLEGLEAILAAPFIDRLESFRLGTQDEAVLARFAAQAMPNLRELVLGDPGDELDHELVAELAEDLARLTDPTLRPRLERIALEFAFPRRALPRRPGLTFDISSRDD